MQNVCRSGLLGLTGLFEGVPVFFDFLKEHIFYKAVMSRLEKAAVGFDRRPDKPVRKRQKGAKKRKISLLREKKDGTERRDSMVVTDTAAFQRYPDGTNSICWSV